MLDALESSFPTLTLDVDVELRRTDYDVDAAVAAYRATDDPLVEALIETLLAPPTGGAVVNAAESLSTFAYRQSTPVLARALFAAGPTRVRDTCYQTQS